MEHWLANAVVAVRPWAAWAGTMLTSWLAWRVYALADGVVVAGLSLWYANRHRKFIVDITWQPGRKPTVKRSINRRLRLIDEFVANAQNRVYRQALILVFFGFFVPSLVLGLGIYFYPWFRPGHDALSVTGCPSPASVAPTFIGTGVFVSSQVLMGMADKISFLLDGTLARVFPVYMPANAVIAGVLAGYRIFISIFGAAFIQLLYAARRLPTSEEITRERADLEKRLAEATH